MHYAARACTGIAVSISYMRSLRVQRRISDFERKAELRRFRQGITRAVRSESRRRLPPRGYSLEQALELYRMVGAPADK